MTTEEKGEGLSRSETPCSWRNSRTAKVITLRFCQFDYLPYFLLSFTIKLALHLDAFPAISYELFRNMCIVHILSSLTEYV